MRVLVLPYRQASVSASALARTLGCRRIRLRNSRYRPRVSDLVINWGNCEEVTESPFDWSGITVLNRTAPVASHKEHSLRAFRAGGVDCPEYTTDKDEALSWLDAGRTVVSRTLLRASGGRGITLSRQGDALPDAPLYVRYIKKSHEYRVHVFNTSVIDTQIKLKRREVPNDEVNYQIRNYHNGFIFGRADVQPCSTRDDLSVRAVNALGLDFGAVDLIYNTRRDKWYVLEVNTAPGLQGSTLSNYALVINQYIQEMSNV